MLLDRTVMILPRDYVHGMDLTRDASFFFNPVAPGRYDVRVRYVGSFLTKRITPDVTPPVVLPDDKYVVYSNTVKVDITE